jgi:hypothetical protein
MQKSMKRFTLNFDYSNNGYPIPPLRAITTIVLSGFSEAVPASASGLCCGTLLRLCHLKEMLDTSVGPLHRRAVYVC